MTILAMLIALGAVLKMIEIGTGEFRISVFEIPLMIAGIIAGPIYGFIVSIIADALYIFAKGWSYSFIMAASTAMWGALSFLTLRKGQLKKARLILFIISVSILNFLINSIQLYIWRKAGMIPQIPIRLVVMVIKWPFLIYGVSIIYRRVLPSFDLQ
jgi:ECF transporter S component (folate family)